jgi:hypothetical protein
MVSNTGDRIERSAAARVSRVEHVGQGALVLAVMAMIVALVPAVRDLAWLPAIPAVLLALSSMGSGVGRKRFSTAALLLGWFAFAYSLAMMLWG